MAKYFEDKDTVRTLMKTPPKTHLYLVVDSANLPLKKPSIHRFQWLRHTLNYKKKNLT